MAQIPSEIGYLMTCDPAMKQFILHLSEERIEGAPFVLADLDATHLLINEDYVDRVKARVSEYVYTKTITAGAAQKGGKKKRK